MQPAERPSVASVVGLRAALAAGRRKLMPQIENDRIVETTDEARAGVTGHNVRYVLLIGTTLAAIVLFAAAYIATL
jgi:hypothetical protein